MSLSQAPKGILQNNVSVDLSWAADIVYFRHQWICSGTIAYDSLLCSDVSVLAPVVLRQTPTPPSAHLP